MFRSSLAIPISLRLLLIVATLSQPLIIQATLRFTQSSQSGNGVFLVSGMASVYTGSALLSGAYWHAINTHVTRLRGLLFNFIYQKSLRLKASKERDSHGATISLLSSDVDAVLQGFHWLHEIWATMITTAISMWMLHAEVGLA